MNVAIPPSAAHAGQPGKLLPALPRGSGGRGAHADPLGVRRPATRRPAPIRRPAWRAPTWSSFAGYHVDPVALLERTFEEVEGYDEIVLLRDIRFESVCEHHMAPIVGRAHVAYLPGRRVVGISKLARVVDAFAKRLQIQEKLTAQIANTINDVLQPRGTAVVLEAAHQCMTTRGVHKAGTTLVTSRMLGAFRDDPSTRRELMSMIGRSPSSPLS